jgi:hypothetical protein
MGSLNALELVARARFWKYWLREPTGSADTLGRVHALLDADGLRQGIHHVYQRLKRKKALPDIYGLGVVVLDGHESHASYLRHCPGCLQRTIHCERGDRIQFYHRQVTLLLLSGAPPGHAAIRLLLDHEPQRSGEDEVETALRLLALNDAICIGMRRDYSTTWPLDRVAIDPAGAPGGIFPTCSPGRKCRLRCASFVPWRPTRYAGNSTNGTIRKAVTGSG